MMLVIDLAQDGRGPGHRVEAILNFKVSLRLKRMTHLNVLSLMKVSGAWKRNLIIFEVIGGDPSIISDLVKTWVEERPTEDRRSLIIV